MTSAVYSRTPNLGLSLIRFNFPNWADDANKNTSVLDAAMAVVGLTITGPWTYNTVYDVGDLAVDIDTNTIWRAEVDHTSSSSGTMAAERAAHPTYWSDASAPAGYVYKTGDTMSGNLTINKSYPTLILDRTGGVEGSRIIGSFNGSVRWVAQFGLGTESGSDSGSNFYLTRYDDDDVAIDNPLSIARSTGVVSMPLGAITLTQSAVTNNTTIATTAYVTGAITTSDAAQTTADNLRVLKAGDTMTGALTVNSTVTATSDIIAAANFRASSTTVTLSSAEAGIVYLRPNGYSNAEGQFTVDNTGNTILSGNTTAPVFQIDRDDETTGSNGANIGYLQYRYWTTTGVKKVFADIYCHVPTATNGDEVGNIVFRTMDGGTAAEKFRIGGSSVLVTGTMQVTEDVHCAEDLTVVGTIISEAGEYLGATGNVILGVGTPGPGTIRLRPNYASATDETVIGTTGNMTVGGNTLTVNAAGASNTVGWHVSNTQIVSSTTLSTTASHHAFYNNQVSSVGTITTAGTATAYNTSSSADLKDIGNDYSPEEAIAVIRADPVKNFKWKSTGIDAVGWIAQHSHAVHEDLATKVEAKAADAEKGEVAQDEWWGIDYGKRTPYLWAALTNALDRIEALEGKVNAAPTRARKK